jgi:hypothetical protein
MDIQETTLPGVGLRHDFTTRDGRRLGVVSYRTGRRDLLLYDPDDADTCREVIRLTQEEADALADLLGAARLIGHLVELQQQVEGLAISWLTIQEARRTPAARSPTPRPAPAPACPSWPCCAPRRPSPRPPPTSASRPTTRCWWSAPRPASGPWPDSWTDDRHGHVIDSAGSWGNVLGQTITTPSPERLSAWQGPTAPP